MAVLKTEKHLLVQLTFAKKADGTLKTIYISDRSFASDYLYPTSPEVFGILDSVSGFGQSMGEIVSKNQSGTVALKSVIGTLAFNKRVSDLLDEYVIVNQDIRGWSFEKSPGQQGDISDLVAEFVGKVAKPKIDPVAQLLILEVNSNDFSTEIVNQRYDGIESQLLNHPDYQTGFTFQLEKSGINNYAPIIFGLAKQVIINKLALINYPTLGGDFFASKIIGSGFSIIAGLAAFRSLASYSISGYRELYGLKPDSTNKYLPAYFNGDAVAGFFSGPGANNGTFDFWNGGNVRIIYVPLDLSDASPFVFNAMRLNLNGIIAGGWTGEVEIQIGKTRLSPSAVNFYFEEVQGARAKVAKTDFASRDYLDFNFEQIFIRDPEARYYIKIVESGLTVGANILLTYTNGSLPVYYQVPNKLYDGEAFIVGPSISAVRQLILYATWFDSAEGNPWNDQLISSDNYITHEFVSYDSANSLTLKNNLTDVDNLILNLDGMADNPDGDITGVPSIAPLCDQILNKAYYILKALYYSQNKQSLIGWDESRFPDAEARSVIVGGVEYNAKTYRQLMLEIAEAGSGALIKNRNGTVSFWTYTCEQTPVDIIAERDCILESIDSLGVESIVNSMGLAYNKKETPMQVSSIEQTYFQDYMLKTDANSQAVYGVLQPDEVFQSNVWIDNFDTANRYTDFKIQQQAFERYEFTIVVPYWKKRYRFHELWDLLWLSHTELPSRYGALPPNKTKPLGEGVDWAIGDVLRHAKSFMCRIVDRQPIFTKGQETGLRFVLRTVGENEQF